MKNSTKNLGFTLVELLVVITILSIISVVAYQNFGGADKGYYPKADVYNADTNLWWYTWSTVANLSNVVIVDKTWDAIISVSTGSVSWGWTITNTSNAQIGAKWVISQDVLWKKYLTTDLYDPELGEE